MSKEQRGSENALAGLHGALTKYFKDRLASKEPLVPSELNAIRQFLKDNGIDCVGNENKDIQDITASLPVFNSHEDDDDTLLN